MSLLIGCPAETAELESRVALSPDAVVRLRRTGPDVIVELADAKVTALSLAHLQAIGTALR